MTWENPWGSSLASQNLDQLSNQYQTQLDALNRMKAASNGVLEEINKELGSLSKEEQKLLLDNQDYLMAKIYMKPDFLILFPPNFHVNSYLLKEVKKLQ